MTPGYAAFAVEVTDPQPGCSVLVIGTDTAADAFAVRVGPAGVIRTSRTLADATGTSDLVCAFGVPDFRVGGASQLTGVAELLAPAGQLWVFDSPAHGESAGPLSMQISTTLSQAGLAIVDILEGRCVIGVCAMVKG
ncbi:hypothetical protein [Rhodococcus sp. SJ-3]|uniref:hypothetical protein n=1 Tax=Rhodococcus sp. SJ-3 TaxID=3454628 RepID=UPI003F7975E9